MLVPPPLTGELTCQPWENPESATAILCIFMKFWASNRLARPFRVGVPIGETLDPSLISFGEYGLLMKMVRTTLVRTIMLGMIP